MTEKYMSTKEKAELVNSVTYQLNDITYLPHYAQKNKFVSPGYGLTNSNEYTATELKKAGAEMVVVPLLERKWAAV
jgi:hypothetical protein